MLIVVQIQEELKVAGGAGYFQRLWDCFAVPRIRRANYGASTVMIAQQMCGINSRSASVSGASSMLTSYSHFFLQFDHLRERWLYGDSSSLCIAGLWCHPSDCYYSYFVPHRHEGTQDFDASSELLHVPILIAKS